MSIEDLSKSIERYKKYDVWNESTLLTEESFNHLQDIMEASKVLKTRVSFNDLVENKYN